MYYQWRIDIANSARFLGRIQAGMPYKEQGPLEHKENFWWVCRNLCGIRRAAS